MLKASENPPMFVPWSERLGELTGHWWVAHTKGRFEKAFAWDLLKRRIGYFLPLTERLRFSGGRKRKVMVPLFTSYVFFCGSEQDRYSAMATNRLCRTIAVNDQESLIGELESIEIALRNKVRLDPYPFAVEGRTCRVKAGPFVGIEGVVLERSAPSRLVLEVRVLGQATVMEIDTDLLEPVE